MPDDVKDPQQVRTVELPHVGKTVLRLGLAANYGLDEAGVRAAADRGVNYWSWSSRMKTATPVLRDLCQKDRDSQVVTVLEGMGLTAGMVRRKVEGALRKLGTDYIDIYLLPWLGRTARLSSSIEKEIADLKREGKIKAVGCSIHDRPRAGQLARDSILDGLMIRYNAKHPGAEGDIFPHLEARNPFVVAYTATSWRQLIRPIKGIEMPPWPGSTDAPPPLTAGLCYRFCLSSPHVHVVLTGPANIEQLDENLAALDQGPLSAEELAWVRDYGVRVKKDKRLDYV